VRIRGCLGGLLEDRGGASALENQIRDLVLSKCKEIVRGPCDHSTFSIAPCSLKSRGSNLAECNRLLSVTCELPLEESFSIKKKKKKRTLHLHIDFMTEQ
jgi:hypothetical protein